MFRLPGRRVTVMSVATVGALVAAGVVVMSTSAAEAAPIRYEAEAAPATCDGVIESNHTGFSGSGFCNANNAVGAAAQFTVTAAAGGTATIAIRYSNGTTAGRPADIIVNGSTVQAASAFDATASWDTWATKTLTASVNGGNNTIRLSPTTANGLANIDYVEVDAGGGGTTTTTTTTTSTTTQRPGAKQMERLNRGVISSHTSAGNYVGWRLLGTDPTGVAFNVYRGSTKVNSSPITNSTNLLDSGAASGASYTVRAVVNGVEQAASEASLQFNDSGYRDIPLQVPAGGTTPDGVSYTYSANDASVGDLDGDGQLEIVLKWDPSNSKDNSQSGYTGDVFVDAYKLNGTRMWRIDLGRNIRAGAHYTQFQVYDYDGDGRAEVAMKTADGTRSGTGQVIGDANADFRNSSGYVLSGPEFLTVFNGQTGAILATTNYVPARGTVSAWGDSYGNRVDRFLAGTAYLDGQRPSIIAARGYYTRTVIVAWDYRNGSLTRRWTFDSGVSGSQYEGQGNHQLSIADVDNDGRDEVIYGSLAVDDNGAPLWNTRLFHGDALHVMRDPNRGLVVFKPHEHTDQPATSLVDARTGSVIVAQTSCGCDNGRGTAGDVYAGNPGIEFWSSAVSGLYGVNGNQVASRKPGSTNFLLWWDADPVRELLDSTHVDKYGTSGDTRLLTGSGVSSNNGTKSTPALSGDLFGDWREEVMWRTSDSSALRIYTTRDVTGLRIPTLLHDPMYRVAIAWQNTAYNQPPHPSFFLGNGMGAVPQPNIYTP